VLIARAARLVEEIEKATGRKSMRRRLNASSGPIFQTPRTSRTLRSVEV
jgi:hypothetical protein